MPPNAAIAGVGKQYDEIVVIVLLMALKSSGGAANPWYKDMSALDGTRSVSGFQHSLRAANKLAGELLEKKTKGEALVPEDVGRTSNGEGCGTVSPKKRKADANSKSSSDVNRYYIPREKFTGY
jgi:hypothetical protein